MTTPSHAVNAVNAVNARTDYFAIFGLARKLSVDLDLLE